MSIIYEAVKKIEEKEKPSLKRKGEKKKFIFLFLILCIIGLYFTLGKKTFKKRAVYLSKKVSFKKNSSENKIKDKSNQSEGLGFVRKYRLEGIIYTSQDPIALINGKRVKINEEFDGLKVIDIGKKEVKLKTKEGKVIYLSLE